MNKFIKLPEVKALTGLSRSSIYGKIKTRDFPHNIKVGAKAVCWLESDIHAWMETCIEQSKIEVLGND
jgi:prophage regulatory protein